MLLGLSVARHVADSAGMSRLSEYYTERVLPVAIDRMCGTKAFRPHRRDTVAGTHGTVLEIGFGSGHNLAQYPAGVSRLLVVEPSARAVELARERTAKAPFPVEFIGLNGEVLPIDDGSIDCVVSTFTLCTIPDATAALREISRVLVAGGTLHVLEHGLADDPKTQRWQHRLDPLQQRVAGGCHLNRHVPSMLAEAGFDVIEMQRWSEGRPKAHTAMTRAVVTPGQTLA